MAAQVKALLLVLLCSCSIGRYAVTHQCATLPTLITDAVITTAVMAAGIHAYNDQDHATGVMLLGLSGVIGLSANIAETACRD